MPSVWMHPVTGVTAPEDCTQFQPSDLQLNSPYELLQ
uniref:Uncharacterized protein n=1 Tax=Arundo donax TaxID=35708 RepID=A0A0A9ECT6_ARUDO